MFLNSYPKNISYFMWSRFVSVHFLKFQNYSNMIRSWKYMRLSAQYATNFQNKLLRKKTFISLALLNMTIKSSHEAYILVKSHQYVKISAKNQIHVWSNPSRISNNFIKKKPIYIYIKHKLIYWLLSNRTSLISKRAINGDCKREAKYTKAIFKLPSLKQIKKAMTRKKNIERKTTVNQTQYKKINTE